MRKMSCFLKLAHFLIARDPVLDKYREGTAAHNQVFSYLRRNVDVWPGCFPSYFNPKQFFKMYFSLITQLEIWNLALFANNTRNWLYSIFLK
jgi:hypothetical protein